MTRARPSLALLGMFVCSLAALLVVKVLPAPTAFEADRDMLAAADLMRRGMQVLEEARLARGLPINSVSDPNQTGMIGIEYSPITSTLGPIEVKRSTTNPDFAAVLVAMFREAGIKRGDLVAAGLSGSFPALSLATYSAAKVMGVAIIAISSIGASTFGATDPSFTWLDMEGELRKSGLIDTRSIAASVGGGDDRLDNPLFPEAATLAGAAIRRNGQAILASSSLEAAVDARMAIYTNEAAGRHIAAFVNIGGAETNLGKGDSAYTLPAGVIKGLARNSESDAGVLFSMARRGIPIINLLDVRDLCLRYDLPFDPIPLPPSGRSSLYHPPASRASSIAIFVAWLALMAVMLVADRRQRRRGTIRSEVPEKVAKAR